MTGASEGQEQQQATPMMSPAFGAIAGALAKAQAEFGPITRNREVTVRMKEGGTYTFAYATLDEVLAATRPALAKHGLAVVQLVTDDKLRTMLLHESGEWIGSELFLPKYDSVQDLGKGLTYVRRYSLVSLLGVAAEEDDDGNTAQGNTITNKTDKAPPRSSAPASAPASSRRKLDPVAASTVRRALGKVLGEMPATAGPAREKVIAKWAAFVDAATGREVQGLDDLFEDEANKVLDALDDAAKQTKQNGVAKE